MVLSGAARLGEDLAHECSTRLGCLVKQGYGLTETSPVTHVCPDDPDKVKPGSVGPCLPNTEMMVVDYDNGDTLGSNQDGEIWICGPQVMKGYLNNPEASRDPLHVPADANPGPGCAESGRRWLVLELIKNVVLRGIRRYGAYFLYV